MSILIASVIAALLLSVFHLARLMWWLKMWQWLRYVLGVLGIALPLSWLFYEWQSWRELLALWVLIVVGGGVMLLWFGLEEMVEQRQHRDDAEQRETALVESIHA